jgi:hypothetical protein
MVVQTPPRHYSIEEYFALEETTEYRVSANCQIPHRQIYERVKFE